MAFVTPPRSELCSTLLNLERPIAARMRAIFYLRSMDGEHRAENTAVLCQALLDKRGTALFRHEIAYVLGQMQEPLAISDLSAVLRDTKDDVVVRHECAEALGAIADASTLELLDAFSSDASPEVAETCAVAARRVRDVLARAAAGEAGAEKKDEANPYESVDPAPAKRVITAAEVPAFAAQLLDQALPLFERYKAMFSLRNAGSKAAVLALCAGFADPSPLFRHEVAYVLGQLQHAASVPALKERTADAAEHEMVRHEAAEALGAIGNSDCVDFLKAYTGSECPVMLRESCTVALDAADYWSAGAATGAGAGEGSSAVAAVQ